MAKRTSLVAALALACASVAPAFAADISHPDAAVTMVDNSGWYGDAFGMGNMGDTFAEHFTFTTSGAVPMDFSAMVSSTSYLMSDGLDITGIALYKGDGTLVKSGASVLSGTDEAWVVKQTALAAGDYYVLVSGTLVSDNSGAFGGSLQLAPVPEPSTYAMMLGGLGLLGFAARRRQR